MTALQKPGGEFRGNVAGDDVRRLVERFRNSWQKVVESATAHVPARARVTVGTVPNLGSDAESLNDTVDGRSDVDASVEAAPVEPFTVEEVDERVPDVRISPAIREASVALDRFHLPDGVSQKGHVPPKMF